MKYIILLFLAVIACSTNHDTFAQNLKPCDLLTITDAEKMIGKAKQAEELTETKDSGKMLRCSYVGLEKVNGRDTNLFLVVELAKDEKAAKAIYSTLKSANAEMAGVEDLNGLGDEAHFHTDGENFYFILARKGDKVVRMKLNKIIRITPPSDFKAAAKLVVEKL